MIYLKVSQGHQKQQRHGSHCTVPYLYMIFISDAAAVTMVIRPNLTIIVDVGEYNMDR